MFEELRNIIIEDPTHYHNVNIICPKTNLQTVYQQGWWITEIFGSHAVLVKRSACITRTSKKPYFICVQSIIDTKQITPQAYKTINKIKQQQWNKYKNYLLGNTNEN